MSGCPGSQGLCHGRRVVAGFFFFGAESSQKHTAGSRKVLCVEACVLRRAFVLGWILGGIVQVSRRGGVWPRQARLGLAGLGSAQGVSSC